MSTRREKLQAWLKAELEKKGRGAKSALATHLGARADAITRMLNTDPGKEVRDISAEELVRMISFFGTSPSEIQSELREDPHPVTGLRVVGRVAANTWIDVHDMDFSYDDAEEVPAVGGYPKEWQYVLIVAGKCLNKLADNGDKLVCLDLIKAHKHEEPGDLVIVERRRFGGQMVERTAKRLRQSAKGMELWPESHEPEYQEPIALYEPHEDVEVVIVAKVLWVMKKP